MVVNGSPDPPDMQDEAIPPIVGNGDFPNDETDSDDDRETNQYDGYAPLPLGPNDESELIPWNNSIVSSESSEDEDTDEAETANAANEVTQETPSVPYIETVDREVVREVWTRPRDHANIEMDLEKAQQVMSAMANFKLPSSAIPEWAQGISEEDWKLHIDNQIRKTQENR